MLSIRLKTHLSELLARVEAGEDIISARGKDPVARLVAIDRLDRDWQRRSIHVRPTLTKWRGVTGALSPSLAIHSWPSMKTSSI
ncbi:type II toxin-antitoxin system prevent-host-death family antitoxin [Neorhizobium galegae]|uniref:type II toxin-antitoxin system Phd/YefM family antitoxin n=1 Tax=Neorhizobium galegae TaxID=399 RepID=UPI0009BB2B7C